MFDKLTGKKKKQGDIYSIPQKKYTTDTKAISKMSSKSLIELYHDQEKYINIICQKLDLAKKQAERLLEKIQQLNQKNQVVNAQILRMTNQHEELSIKFDNLQSSLEIFSSDNEQLFRKQISFLKEQQIPIEKVKNIGNILNLYHQKITLMKKIQQQNKSIKQRYSELQNQLDQNINKIKQLEKQKSYNNLIPSLMQQIQQLKSKKEQSNSQQQQTDKLQQRILQKFKNQFETSSTVKSSEQEQQLQVKQAQINKLKNQLKEQKQKNQQMLSDNQQFTQSIQQYANKVNNLQSQLTKIKQSKQQIENKYEKTQQQCSNLNTLLQNLEKQSKQFQKLQQQCTKFKQQNQNVSEILRQRESSLKTKMEEFAELNQMHQITIQDLKSKTQELERQKKTKATLENMIKSNNNSQIQNLMQLKSKLQRECQQLQKSLDSEKKNVIESQSKCRKISEDYENLTMRVKQMGEQKIIIQQNVNNCLKIAQEEAETSKKEVTQLKKKIEEQKKQIQGLNKKKEKQEEEINNFNFETQKLVKTIQGKDHELRKSYATKQQLEKQKGMLQQVINEKEEEMKIKVRKYESQLNQERIKLESVNRKLNIFENQSEQNKASLEGYYEQLLAKDKKISQMEIKLKDYKYRIQVLRKEKQDLQHTYQNKLSHLQHQQPSQNQLTIRQNTLESKQSQEAKEPIIIVDQEKDLLKNQLFSMKEENKAILSQNQTLREQIQTLKSSVTEKNRNIKTLQQKRDNIMKQMERIRNEKTSQPLLTGSLQLPKPPLSPRNNNQDRQKKIASKALKGFQIMIKLAHQLYKSFVNIFAQQMQEQRIKSLEKEINAIIKRGNDMRDVFEGYLE